MIEVTGMSQTGIVMAHVGMTAMIETEEGIATMTVIEANINHEQNTKCLTCFFKFDHLYSFALLALHLFNFYN